MTLLSMIPSIELSSSLAVSTDGKARPLSKADMDARLIPLSSTSVCWLIPKIARSNLMLFIGYLTGVNPSAYACQHATPNYRRIPVGSATLDLGQYLYVSIILIYRSPVLRVLAGRRLPAPMIPLYTNGIFGTPKPSPNREPSYLSLA